MPSKSPEQQRAAGAALSAQRGGVPKSKLYGASKQMAKMDTTELRKFAGTRHKDMPESARLALAGQNIVQTLLAEEEDFMTGDEHPEVSIARNILEALKRLQGSLPDPTPEQLHAITAIRASAHSLTRKYSLGTRDENLPS